MKCVEVDGLLDSLLDDELEIFYRKQVENHIESCNSCRLQFEERQKLGGLLKNTLPVSVSSTLDDRVMKAFRQRQDSKQKKDKRARLWAALSGHLAIPKPVSALSLLVVAVVAGLFFQLGRMTAWNAQSPPPAPEAAKSVDKYEKIASFNETVPPQIVEIPVTKFVKVPVVKERIVTRVIYVNKQPVENRDRLLSTGAKPGLSLNNSITETDYLTKVSLKGFQPVSDIKLKIIKKGEKNEY